MAGANQPNFAEFESENPKLRKQIAAFDRTTTLSAVAALLTYPSLHANTVRLELLQNLVHRNANGPNKPTVHRLSVWLNKELGPTCGRADGRSSRRRFHLKRRQLQIGNSPHFRRHLGGKRFLAATGTRRASPI